MTDIDAIHKHLDGYPYDHSARLVLADRLEDAGDVKADGYRALALLERVPRLIRRNGNFVWHFVSTFNVHAYEGRLLGVN